MIVKQIDSKSFQRNKREGLPGSSYHMSTSNLALKENASGSKEKAFSQYLLEAFQGEFIQNNSQVSSKISALTRNNLRRLSM